MVHLLNMAVFPHGCNGRWDVKPLSPSDARAHIRASPWVSHIGHQSTATLASALLGVDVPADRAPWDGTGLGIAVQLTFRGEEGRIYTEQEMMLFHSYGQIEIRLLRWLDQPGERNEKQWAPEGYILAEQDALAVRVSALESALARLS